MKEALQTLAAAVVANTSVTESVIALIKGAATVLADNATDENAVLEIAATLNANADKLAEAVKSNTATANTEGAAPPAEIVPAPASEAPVTPPADTPAEPAADPAA